MKYLLIGLSCVLFFSCKSSSSVQLNVSGSAPFPDGSMDMSMDTFVGSDTIHFGTSHIFYKAFSFKGFKDASLFLEIWYPATTNVDSSHLILLIPGFQETPFSMYPLAIVCTNAKNIVAIVNPRGYGINMNAEDDYRSLEIKDLIKAFDSYEHVMNKNISINAFGSSIGSVIALNLLIGDSRVKAAALESIMNDPKNTARKLLTSEEQVGIESVYQTNNYTTSPQSIFNNAKVSKPLLVIWGKEDKLVPQSERNELKLEVQNSASNSTILEVDGIGHVLRYGFPLTAKNAIELNSKIVKYLISFKPESD